VSEPTDPRSGQDFERRLDRLRAAERKDAGEVPRQGQEEPAKSAFAVASRIGTELVVALAVGIGIGLLIDHWLGSQPWFLIVFALLGGAAGILNVFRLMTGQGYAAGYRPPKGKDKGKT
jgi:ATP synthase protein I